MVAITDTQVSLRFGTSRARRRRRRRPRDHRRSVHGLNAGQEPERGMALCAGRPAGREVVVDDADLFGVARHPPGPSRAGYGPSLKSSSSSSSSNGATLRTGRIHYLALLHHALRLGLVLPDELRLIGLGGGGGGVVVVAVLIVPRNG